MAAAAAAAAAARHETSGKSAAAAGEGGHGGAGVHPRQHRYANDWPDGLEGMTLSSAPPTALLDAQLGDTDTILDSLLDAGCDDAFRSDVSFEDIV